MTLVRFDRFRLLALSGATILLVACASTPVSNARLEEARNLYTQASNDADAARSAPLELRSAQQALQQAETALKAGDDASLVEHYAYLARQRSATALQAGEIARAEKVVSASGTERGRILMDARTREAELRTAEAQQARQQAEQAQAQAEKDRQAAEQARQQAQLQLAAAEAAKAKAVKLQAQLTELEAQQTDRGMVLTLGDVLFDSGRAELKPGAFATIDRLGAFMRDNAERSLTIEGYTDSVGSDAFNLDLSQRRAGAVRMALVQRGIDGGRITAQGFGEAKPVASNTTAEGRQRNRRVEIVISSTPKS